MSDTVSQQSNNLPIDQLFDYDGPESIEEFLDNNIRVYSQVYPKAANTHLEVKIKEAIDAFNGKIKGFRVVQKNAINQKLKRSLSSFFYIQLGIKKTPVTEDDAYSWLKQRLEGFKALLSQSIEEAEVAESYEEGKTALPPETYKILKKLGISKEEIEALGWIDVPSLSIPSHRLTSRELMNNTVDAYEAVEPLLNEPTLEGSLRIMDIANGCGIACDTCLADAPLPSKIFTYESLKRLFADERFLKMLQPDSFRIGSAGDISDHPDAIKIIEMVMQATEPLDKERNKEGKHHKLRIYTNYRPQREACLNGILDLAIKNPDRFHVIVSIPKNKKDTVNERFRAYARTRADAFGLRGDTIHDYQYAIDHPKHRNIEIFDVSEVNPFVHGRVLDNAIGRSTDEQNFEDRGFVKTYFNPDALWLMMYTTTYESHTCRKFTPMTTANLKALNHLPWHSDFSAPPNWPGGVGKEKEKNVNGVLSEIRRAVNKTRKLTIIQ